MTELLEEDMTLPIDQSGHEQWRTEQGRGRAGAFTLEVADIVGALEAAVNAPRTPESHSLFQKTKLMQLALA